MNHLEPWQRQILEIIEVQRQNRDQIVITARELLKELDDARALFNDCGECELCFGYRDSHDDECVISRLRELVGHD